jgi:hypothetical protein
MRKIMRGLATVMASGLFAGAVWAGDSGAGGDEISADGAPLPSLGTDDLLGGSSKGLNLTCDWRPANGTPTASSPPNQIRYGYIELAAGYWQFFLSPYFPAGTRFHIDGQYPAARNFSYQLYDGPKGGLGYLPDYKVQPDPGSQSPFNGINTLDTAVKPGGHYTIHIVYGTAPATPPPNTIYVDASHFSLGSQAVFVYRIYNAFAGIAVADHGGVPMPVIYKETAQGDVPLSSLDQKLICDAGINQRNARRVIRAQVSDQLHAKPEYPNPIPAQPVPAPPLFQLRDNPTDVLANADNRYIYTILSQKPGDLVLMRAKAPTYATGPGAGSDPQLRHWSICQNAYVTVETYACIEDTDAVLDGDGYFNIVISVPAKRPAYANHAHQFDWLTYGTDDEAAPIFRHMLASPNFKQSAFQVPSGQAAQAPAIMGEYFPVATYCSGAVFDAHAGRGETPKQVFAGCAAGR